MLAGLLLGSKRGTISVVAYMLLGLAGLPIFSEGGGLWYVFKPSFGYIIGFCLGTYVTGRIAEHLKKKTIFRYLLANLADIALSILGAIIARRVRPVVIQYLSDSNTTLLHTEETAK